MPANKNRKLTAMAQQLCIIPGKLADESQLGGLSSLLLPPEPPCRVEKKPPSSIPLKKRYRDSIFLQYTEPPPQEPPPSAVTIDKIEVEKSERLSPTTEEKEDDVERLKIWRTHILEENNNLKDTRSRACKGQRYREFMWTNYSTRRKSNRWELNQDKRESLVPVKKQKTARTENNICDKSLSMISNYNPDEKTGPSGKSLESDSQSESGSKSNSQAYQDDLDSDRESKRKSPSPSIGSASSHSKSTESLTNGFDNCDNISLEVKSEIQPIEANNNLPVDQNEKEKKAEMAITGSRKRKVRRQEIRRLTPGTSMNDIAV